MAITSLSPATASKDYWRLGAIFGVIFIAVMLIVAAWPLFSDVPNKF